MRIHRVGTVTLGLILIASGILFLCRLLIPTLSYELILRLWPLMLILFGAETLYCNRRYEDFRYDFGAICIAILLAFLCAGMASAELAIQSGITYPPFVI